ncbi:MAG: hypothetical protein OSJ70_07180 [Bacilli bacterium]|nr:hypothetical protein [Bacilli bacterium]
MHLDKLRYFLTEHFEKKLYTYENFKLLIHPSVTGNSDLLNRLEDDINLMPEISKTLDNTDIKFYRYDYNENLYSKSELLAFILASISEDWDIIKGIDSCTGKLHFWLKHEDIIYDPSLAVITKEDIYSKRFKKLTEIKKEDIRQHLVENNNVSKFYEKTRFINSRKNKSQDFSITFINKIIEEFNKNVNREVALDEDKIEHIKEYFMFDDFIELRQVLSQKRKSYLKGSNIAVHPSIDNSILDTIKKTADCISCLMKQEYDMNFDYYKWTLGNCYGLSIMFTLFNGNFKLVQGGIPYQRHDFGISTNHFYQHSWLEIDDIVYDPALKIVTPKELYYTFVQKQDEYSKEETENILRRIGFNFTHFRDFMTGIQIGNNESIRYRSLVNKIDSQEMNEQAEKLLSLVQKYKHD